jgi:hypothetical protein
MKLTTFKQKMNILKLVLVFVGAFTIYSFTSAPSATKDPITTTDVKSVESHSGTLLVTFTPDTTLEMIEGLFRAIQTDYHFFGTITDVCPSNTRTFIVRYGRGAVSRSQALPSTILDPDRSDTTEGPARYVPHDFPDALRFEGAGYVVRIIKNGTCDDVNTQHGGPGKIKFEK